jgi:hypothetical protein
MLSDVETTLLTFATAEDGLAPLGDYLLELDAVGTPWRDIECMRLIYQAQPYSEAETQHYADEGVAGWFRANAAMPTPTFARAIAAVLMGGVFMPNEPGGVVRRCELVTPAFYRRAIEERLRAYDTETAILRPATLRK